MQEEAKKATDHLYWARSSSNKAPPPKPISAEEAQKLAGAGGSGGSAWNKGGSTWEEKKINSWAQELLKDTLLPEMAWEVREHPQRTRRRVRARRYYFSYFLRFGTDLECVCV